eukprot:15361322-Ditylum_brightwellii.AAC.1
MPAAWLREAIFESDEKDHFMCIPIDVTTAKAFDQKHANIDTSYPNKAADHCSNYLLCWAWGLGAGKINKTYYNICPEDSEFQNYNIESHNQCIAQLIEGPGIVQNPGENKHNSSVICQLTNIISRQKEKAWSMH